MHKIIKEILIQYFSIDELNTLLFDLDIDYENFKYSNKETKVLEIVTYFKNVSKLEILLNKILVERPELKSNLGNNIISNNKEHILVLHGFENLSIILNSCISWIRYARNSDGGLTFDDKGSESGTWATSRQIWAIYYGGADFSQNWIQEAVYWVAKNINDDGGVPITCKGDYSVTDATAQTVIAFTLFLSIRNDKFIEDKLMLCTNWLVDNFKGKGWNWKKGDENIWVASSAYAMLALHYASKYFPLLPNLKVTAKKSLEWITNIQNGDGGWGELDGKFSKVAISAITTSLIFEVTQKANLAAINYIQNEYNESSGEWEDTFDRPSGHTVIRFANAYCIKALVQANSDLVNKKLIKGYESLFKNYDGIKFKYKNTNIASWVTADAILALSLIGNRINLPNTRKSYII